MRDPEAFKQIAIKDFDHFDDHVPFLDDPLWKNSLVFMKGEKWRQMRSTLSPAFTGSKMRQMFGLITECADDVVKHFLKLAGSGQRINVEMKDFFRRYTNDVIGTCAFGLKINSFEEPENDFYIVGQKLTDFVSFKAVLKLIMVNTPFARFFGIKFIAATVAKQFKDLILDTIEVRKKNNIYRPDMINIMMQIREGTLQYNNANENIEKDGFATAQESNATKVSVNRKWTDDEIVGQCFIFFAAGFDTTAVLLTFTAYELAANPDIQQKLYEEIVETNACLAGNGITYDALQKMKYLDQIISEVLRKWPPASFSDRLCMKDYTFDNGNGVKYTLNKDAEIIVPIYSIHHDPRFFSEPEKFDPERFSDENKNRIIPGTYIPFGIGIIRIYINFAVSLDINEIFFIFSFKP